MAKIPECDCGEMAVHKCGFCGRPTCNKHILPENHACEAVERQRSMLSDHGFMAAPIQKRVPTQMPAEMEREFGLRPVGQFGAGMPKFDLRKNPLLTLALGMCIGYVLCMAIGAVL